MCGLCTHQHNPHIHEHMHNLTYTDITKKSINTHTCTYVHHKHLFTVYIHMRHDMCTYQVMCICIHVDPQAHRRACQNKPHTSKNTWPHSLLHIKKDTRKFPPIYGYIELHIHQETYIYIYLYSHTRKQTPDMLRDITLVAGDVDIDIHKHLHTHTHSQMHRHAHGHNQPHIHQD